MRGPAWRVEEVCPFPFCHPDRSVSKASTAYTLSSRALKTSWRDRYVRTPMSFACIGFGTFVLWAPLAAHRRPASASATPSGRLLRPPSRLRCFRGGRQLLPPTAALCPAFNPPCIPSPLLPPRCSHPRSAGSPVHRAGSRSRPIACTHPSPDYRSASCRVALPSARRMVPHGRRVLAPSLSNRR